MAVLDRVLREVRARKSKQNPREFSARNCFFCSKELGSVLSDSKHEIRVL
jgi:hypothetical protein